MQLTRRQAAWCIGVGVPAAIIGAIIGWKSGSPPEPKLKSYGTVRNPDYLITAELPDGEEDFLQIRPPIVADYERLEDCTKMLIQTRHRYNDLDQRVISLESGFDQKGAQSVYGRMQERGLGQEIIELMKDQEVSNLLIATGQRWHDIDMFILQQLLIKKEEIDQEQKLAKFMFEILTGKQFPHDTVIIKETHYKEAIDGYHDSIIGKVSYKHTNFYCNLLTLLHELGHVAAQHEETNRNKKSIEWAVLEEACAYTFTHAALYVFSVSENSVGQYNCLKFLFEYELSEAAKEFYTKSAPPEGITASRGAAIALAASQVYKNPYEAFNHLATVRDSRIRNIDSRVMTKIGENKKIFTADLVSEERQLIGQVRKLDRPLQELPTRYQKLLQRCYDAGVKLTPDDTRILAMGAEDLRKRFTKTYTPISDPNSTIFEPNTSLD